MNLRSHIDAERGRAAAIAGAIGVSPVMISQWAASVKSVPVERCTAIEVATNKTVMRWDLRPDDWHRIWPELIGADGAPSVPVPDAPEKPLPKLALATESR